MNADRGALVKRLRIYAMQSGTGGQFELDMLNASNALSARGGEQTETVSVPRDLLHCTLLLFRGALDCKDWIWSPDQWEAGDTWCKELQAMLAAAKEGR